MNAKLSFFYTSICVGCVYESECHKGKSIDDNAVTQCLEEYKAMKKRGIIE